MSISFAEERNQKVYELLIELYKESKNSPDTYPLPFERDEIECLFNTHIWGHREITLTILIARLLDKKFKASEDFYSCNPRSLYELPIRKFLREKGVPHKKSGPLNVAKNIQKINTDWAINKRGGKVAMCVVEIVKKIESVSDKLLRKFAVVFLKRYCQEAKKINELKFVSKPNQNPIFLNKLCHDLIDEVPDGGSIPQIIVGLLMFVFHTERNDSFEVTGYLDSVSTTNTTSKKAGDIMEKSGDHSFIYEVTVKEFSENRLNESYEALKAYDKKNEIKEIFVICRSKDFPNEVEDTFGGFFLGEISYQDVVYYFIDIYQWILSKLFFLSPQGRSDFYLELINYINEPNTSEKVKKYFKQWHTDH